MQDLPVAKETVCALRAAQKRWAKLLDGGSMLYLYGMTGFGKTTQALSFAGEHYKKYIRFTANEDPFLDQVAEWLAQHKQTETKTLLILDDLQWVLDPEKQQQLFHLLLPTRACPKLHILLISRAALPGYLSSLWVTQQLVVEDSDCLRLAKEQVRELLLSCHAPTPLLTDKTYGLMDRILQACNGYAMGVVACVHRMAEYPEDFTTALALATQDVKHFLDQHLMDQWPYSRQLAVLRLCVFQSFTKAMAKQVLGTDPDKILQDFIETGSFLKFQAPDTYTITPFFRAYLEERLRTELATEWRSLYETAAACYEEQRNIEQALYCYKQAGRRDKIAELVVWLSENADGCSFARIAQQYMDELSPDMEQRDPKILGAKALLAAYRMQPEQCMVNLEQLRQMAQSKDKSIFREEARAAYVRTVIACPYDTADTLKDNMIRFVDYALHGGFPLRNITPTGNLPSLINGGLDLLSWDKNKKLLYPIIKSASEKLMGVEAVGIADASMGEILYEQNQKTKAMTSLTKALSDAGLKGNIRVEYAATGIMARLFQSEGENAAAISVLQNIRQKATQQHFIELLPNIDASLALCALLDNDGEAYNRWLEQDAIDEHQDFYITARFQLLTKARVYTALGRTLEALHIIELLSGYAATYHRPYLQVELATLKAIILYRRGEEWQETLHFAVKQASAYGLVRIFADQGTALLPLWQSMERDEEIPTAYRNLIARELKVMEKLYPHYLAPPRRFGSITDKEMEVLRLMAQGKNNTQIAQELDINLGTAKFHVKNIMQKLNAKSRTVAVKAAQEQGML